MERPTVQHFKGRAGIKSGIFHEHAAQTVVQHAGEKLRALKPGQRGTPRFEHCEHLAAAVAAQKIYPQTQPVAAGGDAAGNIKCGGA